MPEASSSSLSLDAWLVRLERQHPVSIDLGLERVARVGRRMGLFDAPLATRLVTVAGTNGKGSTVAMLEALAQAHGLSTATYTSPHLLRYNERLRLDGQEADDATLIRGFERVEEARLAGEPISLTYFEAGTLGALWSIAERRPDLAILEVGLGGRLDAVNILDADVGVVTTVAQDHAVFLGTDLEGIGREKAGILRAGRPAVLGSTVLPASVREVADALGAEVHALGERFHRVGEAKAWEWQGLDVSGCPVRLKELPDPGLPLDNAATALQALALAGVSLDEVACRRALAAVTLPGRMQWLGNWCLDVGHNPHAAGYLAARLAERPCAGRRIGLLGMLADKDADGVIEALAGTLDAWVAVGLDGERSRSADDLAATLEAHGQRVLYRAVSPTSGAEWLADELGEDDEALVCGSFFTVAEVLAWWESRLRRRGHDEIRNA
ncbi:bifunctional folylpolyglutamate synthase/dihydrofolate synthase [Litchfieldella qijiaojingensis]|uniref:Dihydrofolate synthase/folylpolyglutamate synthase n=1 Tax=Litchfieldella qijiaojingensis TaxID=980347 RepID=A0ABQ2YRQ2_9GAMM|nr:bifunctional tetrahydrofolate synthase/dihydrofolate synthase [Halomonas qijiaojingensis]GGX93106.1 bifunctional folylpolyglutamate synthase/dihydrofolate synthase [Halomonas qijiaojingensis]